MSRLFLIGLAGFVGTLGRYWLSGVIARRSIQGMMDRAIPVIDASSPFVSELIPFAYYLLPSLHFTV